LISIKSDLVKSEATLENPCEGSTFTPPIKSPFEKGGFPNLANDSHSGDLLL